SIEREGSYSDWEGRSQRFHPVRSPLGMSRPDWQILQGLSEALGKDMGFRSIDDVRTEMASLMGDAGAEPTVPPRTQKDGPPTTASPSSGDTELRLFTYPLLVDEGRQLDGADLLKATLELPAFIEVHPDDAARLGLQDGSQATIATTAGQATLSVQVSDG